jgi:predicted nucleic acid-binding protein
VNLVIDSYAWVELFLGSRKGEKVSRMIAGAEQVRTPDIVLAEISRKYHRENVDDKKTRSRLQTISTTSLVTPIDTEVALEAGRAYLELSEKARREKRRSPSLFDAIVLATARAYSSKVVTGDEHFEALPETISI